MEDKHSLPRYQTTKVQIDQAATNITRAIKAIPCGCFAWCMITWRFFFRSCGAVVFDTGFSSNINGLKKVFGGDWLEFLSFSFKREDLLPIVLHTDNRPTLLLRFVVELLGEGADLGSG